MRIAMVSGHASPLAAADGDAAGGLHVHLLELSAALADAGHEVTIWTRRESADLPDAVPLRPGVEVRHVPAGPAGPIPADDLVPHLPALARGLGTAWEQDRPDVVHAHFWLSGMAALAAAAGRIPVVQTFHTLGSVEWRHREGDEPRPDGRVRAELAVARTADRVIATSTDELFELARLGTPRRRVTVVPCGVDTSVFTPDGPATPRTDRPRLVSVGLARRKGVDEVVEALRRVPEAELLVAGGGEADANRVRAHVFRTGLTGRVHLVGHLARPAVAALLRSADAAVCAPWYEPFGMVPLEAMACGRPVVASDVGGMQDTVVEEVTGLLVPPRRPDALAAALRDLLGSPTRAAAFGIAGRDRVLARYDRERVAAATAAIYAEARDARSPTNAARAH